MFVSPKMIGKWPTSTWKDGQHHSLTLTEMHIKTCEVWTAMIKKGVRASKHVGQEWGETGTLHTIDGNTKLCSCFGKWYTFPQKLKIEPTHDPVITLLAVNPKELKTGSQKWHFHTYARSSVIDSKCKAEAGPSLAGGQQLRFRPSSAGVQVQSLVRKLRSHMLQGTAKKFKKRINQILTVFKKRWK